MIPCRYFTLNQSTNDMNFDLAKFGEFMQIGSFNGESMAIVVDKQTLKVEVTFVDYIQFIESSQEVLQDEIISVLRGYVPKKKQDEVESEIVQLFKKYSA